MMQKIKDTTCTSQEMFNKRFNNGFNLLRAISDLSLVRSPCCKSDTIGKLQHSGQLLNNITTCRLPVQPCRTYRALNGSEYKFPHERTNARTREVGVDEKQHRIKEIKELENSYVYPPQEPGEPRRPGEICVYKPLLKYSWKKMWYIAAMIRGMTIDEALKQLSFSPHKGAYIIKKILLDLQKEAVEKHVCEYKSNLWIEASEVKGNNIQTPVMRLRWRKYSSLPIGPSMQFTSYFVRLREGKPPKHYYPPPATGYEKMEDYIKEQRRRTITMSL